MIRVGSVVIRVTDLDAQKRFWMQALDYVGRPGDDDPEGTRFCVIQVQPASRSKATRASRECSGCAS